MMRLAVLLVLLITFAQRLCGAESVCDGYISEAVSFVPVVGNFRDLGCGLHKSDAWDVTFGAGGLVADVVSFGAYSAAKATTKVAKAVRTGKKGESLVKAARTSKMWATASRITDTAIDWVRQRGKSVVGNSGQLGRGLQNSNAWDVASGSVGLVTDGVYLKAAYSAKASTGKEGESLAKAERIAAWTMHLPSREMSRQDLDLLSTSIGWFRWGKDK